MKNSQKGFATIPLIIAIVVVLAIISGIYFYETKTKSPTDTNIQSQNNPSPSISNTIPITTSSASCGDFAALSDYVLKNIQQPDSQNTMQANKNVLTSIRWKRSLNESFVSYPILKSIQVYYGNEQVNRSYDFVVSAMKNNSDALDKTIDEKVKSLGLSADPLNTSPFQSFSSQDIYLRTFGFRGTDNLYSITLKVEGGGHQAPPIGVITITCGKATNQYDKVYNILNFKADASVQDSYDNDYVAITDVSSDKMVYALLGSSNHIKIANYYYFDGTTVKLVSKNSYPAQCAGLESKKVGFGMRCVDMPSYNQRTVTYISASNVDTNEQRVLATAREVIRFLSARDYQKLGGLVSSDGLSLNLYPQLDLVKNLIPKSEVSLIPNDTKNYLWGYTDGKGDPINLTRAQFLTTYIYNNSIDYLNAPDIAVNKKLGGSNSLNTIDKDANGRTYVAFHFSGFDSKYGGMDWTTLYLVFDSVNGEYKLRAITKDNWTI